VGFERPAIDRRWSHEVVEVLGPGFSGVRVTDCFRAYDHRGEQKCFAHLLRELGRLQREKKRGTELAGLLREALALREEKGRREPAGFEARLQELEAKLSARMAEKRRFTDRDHARWARRLRKRRFLRVEPPGGAGPPTGGPGPPQDPAGRPNPCGVGQLASNPEATGPRDADLPDIGPDGPGPASPLVPSPGVGHLMTPRR
jgi:hypothetical protein